MTRVQYSEASDVFVRKLRELPQEYKYLIIFHFSRNNLSYLRAWAKALPVLGVISIPYSEQKSVKDEIAKLCPVYSLTLEEIPGLIVRLCKEYAAQKIILVEIGGYSAAVANQLSNVVLTVEDTARGQRQFQEHEQKLKYPVVSIARTSGKKMEDDAIGYAIVESTSRIVSDFFGKDALKTKNVLVMGYGGVGKATARYLKTFSRNVAVYDTSAEARESAKSAGYDVGEKTNSIENADVIVGCTGNQSVKTEDLSHLRDGVILISGSSRQVEFPYHALVPHRQASSAGETVETFKVNARTVYIAYRGHPINFCFDAVLGRVFDIPMTLLAQGVLYGLRTRLENKVYELPKEEERDIVFELTAGDMV